MQMKNTVAYVLAGGKKPSLDILSRKRAKAAIPFGSFYRIIDFVLSNVMHSGIQQVGVLTQYRPESLMDHIGNGAAWDLHGKRRRIQILPPYQRRHDSDWYKGTADALYQNMNIIFDNDPQQVLIASGDHINHIDYQKVLDWHFAKNASVTIVTRPYQDAPLNTFGVMNIDEDFRIIEYKEKPDSGVFHNISLGIYIFDTEVLIPLLKADAKKNTTHDIGRDLIEPIILEQRVFAYPFMGPWLYLGDIRDYWDANMELLKEDSLIKVREWGVETNMYDGNKANLPPTRFRGLGSAEGSMIGNNCFIEGTVRNSVLFDNIVVEKNAIIEGCILMDDVVVHSEAHLVDIVSDKKVVFGERVRCGFGEDQPNEKFPQYYATGITVFAKGVRIAPHMIIGRNCLLFCSPPDDTRVIESGKTIGD